MSRIFGENLKKNHMMLLSYCPFLNCVLCNFANVISRKVLKVEARNFYQLVKNNEKIIWWKLKTNHIDFF